MDVRPDHWDNSYIAANGSAIVFQDEVCYYYQGTDSSDGWPEIGLAVSADGYDFSEREDEPVLRAGEEGEWDCRGVADPYVIKVGNYLYMYYLGQDAFGLQKIGVARSGDGKVWTKYKNNPILDVGVLGAFDENGVGEPSVIYQAPYFYMLYTGRSAEEVRNIGAAASNDGVHWKKLNYQGMIDLSQNSWDDKVVCDTAFMGPSDDGVFDVLYGGGNVAAPAENLNGKIGRFRISFDGVKDSTGFDASEWQDLTFSSTDIVKGSYEIERDGANGPFIWVSDCCSVLLENVPDRESIEISGYMPLELHKQAGADEVVLDVWLNGVKTASETYGREEDFVLSIDKKDLHDENELWLEVTASSCVRPKDIGQSEDNRALSWRCRSIVQK